ncbi:hypothetical protein NECAME_02301 [Necator americanus]|uniref:Uncharacterized protein n=1 Tax=Necator americanus TaxID=51031 RepID=W2TIR0_NECAM|nr:hypothetical protein NECAME_02301 [Necator americanus]ETN80902.1 hypothetical protein NECAME_02301 [Necator americanus]
MFMKEKIRNAKPESKRDRSKPTRCTKQEEEQSTQGQLSKLKGSKEEFNVREEVHSCLPCAQAIRDWVTERYSPERIFIRQSCSFVGSFHILQWDHIMTLPPYEVGSILLWIAAERAVRVGICPAGITVFAPSLSLCSVLFPQSWIILGRRRNIHQIYPYRTP